MSRRKQRKLENTVAAVQARYGPQALYRAGQMSIDPIPPHISTGFKAFDAVTGCHGIPLGNITLLSGHATSGKLTLAYKALAYTQRSQARRGQPASVGIVDLARHTDPDYLARCGVDLAHLLIARPHAGPGAVDLLVDLIRSRQVRLLLLDSLGELFQERAAAQRFNATLGPLINHVRRSGCGLLLIDEPDPPWWRRLFQLWLPDPAWLIRQTASLHVEIKRERWLRRAGQLVGYQAQARVLRSRWRPDQAQAAIEIRFNGSVQAQSTW